MNYVEMRKVAEMTADVERQKRFITALREINQYYQSLIGGNDNFKDDAEEFHKAYALMNSNIICAYENYMHDVYKSGIFERSLEDDEDIYLVN